MRLKLWKQVNLSMLIPVLIATAIILYAVYNLGTISKRIKFIEIADDINLTLLELRRYEKNILLFHEDKNIEMFNSYLEQIDKAIQAAEKEIIEKSSRLNFSILQDNMRIYRDTAKSLAAVIKTDQKLLNDIRPIGRLIEKNANKKEMALELRRWEKNFIIYREQKALDKVKQIANDLTSVQPQLGSSISSYLGVFDSFVKNELLKNELIEQMRSSGRSIQTLTMEFSERKRIAIDGTICFYKRCRTSVFIKHSNGAQHPWKYLGTIEIRRFHARDRTRNRKCAGRNNIIRSCLQSDRRGARSIKN
jgi:hypothetical protein